MGTPSTNRHLERTPKVERLLGALRRKLGRFVLFHGTGTLLAVLACWLAFAFVADWGLRVPRVIRIGHGVVLFVLFGMFLWRYLLRPLRRIPDRTGLALLIERAHPDLHELLSSATQFQVSGSGEGDSLLEARVLERADEQAATLSAREVVDHRLPRNRFLLGTSLATLLAVGGMWQPDHARIFLNRMLGGDLTWPRRTHLTLQIPGLITPEQAALRPERYELRVARGTDIPIVVHADGVIPDEVVLHFDDGRELSLKRTGSQVFRTMLSSCQEDVAFHATGGDNEEGVPRVEVTVLQPPDVAAIAIRIEPPAYTGLPARMEVNSHVDVPQGSRLRVHVATLPPDATGTARLLPADVSLPLSEAPFPALASDDAESTNPEDAGGLVFEHLAERSGGFQVLLEDRSGLSNPDPALWQIKVTKDRAPEILVMSPTRSDFEIVIGGVIPLRARITDDFGILSAGYRIRPGLAGDDLEPVHAGEFALRFPAQESGSDLDVNSRAPELARRLALGSELLEVDALGHEGAPLSVDQRFVIELVASDRHEPQPNVTETLPIRARVVAPEELLRRMQERLAKAGSDARQLSDLQVEKRRRVEELIEAFDSDETMLDTEGASLAAALAGQRRVLGDAQALSRTLAAVTEDILYARLDEKADQLLAFYAARLDESLDVGFQAAPWRALARGAEDGSLGAAGFARNLVLLVDLALEITDDHVQAAGLALDVAERAHEAEERVAALVRASELQTSALAGMQNLMEKLAEWDNFQNVLALTRDILNRQKTLLERTQQFAKQGEK